MFCRPFPLSPISVFLSSRTSLRAKSQSYPARRYSPVSMEIFMINNSCLKPIRIILKMAINLTYNATMEMVKGSSVVMDLIGLVYSLIIDQSHCLYNRSQIGTETSPRNSSPLLLHDIFSNYSFSH